MAGDERTSGAESWLSEQERVLIEMQARICHVLSSPRRLEVLYALRDGEVSAGELARLLDTSQANVSQHLALMRQHGMVTARKDGQTMYYRLVSREILGACDAVRRVLLEQLTRQQELLQPASDEHPTSDVQP